MCGEKQELALECIRGSQKMRFTFLDLSRPTFSCRGFPQTTGRGGQEAGGARRDPIGANRSGKFSDDEDLSPSQQPHGISVGPFGSFEAQVLSVLLFPS